jgi:hypothetical protein
VPEPLRAARTADVAALRAGRLPARLRLLLSVPGWSRRPEPRVRYGQSFLPGIAALGRLRPPGIEAALERARSVRLRRFTYLGHTETFAGRVEWEPRGVPEGWRLALNGLEDLVSLAVAAAVAPTPAARREWYEVQAALVRDWIHGARPGRGTAWRLPSLARRIPNLVHAYGAFAAELRDDARGRRALLESIYRQATALAALVPGAAADPSMVSAGRALFVAGRFFDGMEARGWLEAGAAILWGQLREQVNEDGGHCSRNPAVHAQVLRDYVEVLAMLIAARDDVPIWARKRVKGMADFLLRLLHPDGEIPLFHQAALDVAPSAGDLLAVAAIVLHEPECAPPGELGLWPLLLVGEPGHKVHANLPRRYPVPEARALRRTGFYVLPGEAGDAMILDGATPPPKSPAGLFAYELSVGGERMVVGAGVGEEPWFRSARAHNVLVVGGAGRPAGDVEVGTVRWLCRDGMVHFAGATAESTPGARPRRQRHVFCLPGRFWLVCDQVFDERGGAGEIESLVHFHPDVRLHAACRERVAIEAVRSSAARLTLVPAGADEVRIVHGEGEGDAEGWYAPRHGMRVPAPVVVLAAGVGGPHVVGYALLPRCDLPAALHLEHDAFHLRATLRLGDEEFLLSVVQGDVEMTARRV